MFSYDPTNHPPTPSRQHGPLPGWGHAPLELYGLYALVHDRVPGVVRRVDRVHVGLYAGRRRLMHPLFPGHCGDRKLGGK